MTDGNPDDHGVDVLIRFHETMGFLSKSAAAFDAGDHSEALRLATAVRTLTYDEGYGDSVLTQLGVKDRVQWRSFYVPFGFDVPPDTPMFGTALYGHVMGGDGHSIMPLDLGAEGRTVPYSEWWTVEPVIQFGDGHNTRAQLVLGLANQDGGTHVDLKGKHLTALRSGSPTVVVEGRDVEAVEQRALQRNLLHVQMRAVASEVLHTINRAIDERVIRLDGAT